MYDRQEVAYSGSVDSIVEGLFLNVGVTIWRGPTKKSKQTKSGVLRITTNVIFQVDPLSSQTKVVNLKHMKICTSNPNSCVWVPTNNFVDKRLYKYGLCSIHVSLNKQESAPIKPPKGKE